MKFGKVDNPELVDFSLPLDHPDTKTLLQKQQSATEKPKLFVGFPTWNKAKLANFYPRGTKDELVYYSSQFNAIELNATFYRIFPKAQFEKWRDKTPDDFVFFPKVVQNISHWQRLKDTENVVTEMLYAIEGLEHKLGRVFLQTHNNFSPNDFSRVVEFVEKWPKSIPLAMEFRHTDWYSDKSVAEDLFQLLESNQISNIITDTAGRRDLLHMRLTTPSVFVRFTAANHTSDFQRLDDWIEKLANWVDLGLKEIDFFIHQNAEKENPLLASYFIEKINNKIGTELAIPTSN